MPATLTSTRVADPDAGEDHLDDVAADFARVRPRLLGIAYRILGSWSEAEDILQDAWVRWQLYDRSRVLNPTAFLATTTTRLAINAAQSARIRHESSFGPGLLEPADDSGDPALGIERNEDLEHGIRVLVQRLTPNERAAYVLRQAFDYPYPQIAEVLEISEANARQIGSRAGRRLSEGRHQAVPRSGHERLLQAFVAAAQHGDVKTLRRLFALDSVNGDESDGLRTERRPLSVTNIPSICGGDLSQVMSPPGPSNHQSRNHDLEEQS